MKKLSLALILVLSMASVVSATGVPMLDILRNGDPYYGEDVEPSDIITIIFMETDLLIASTFVQGFTIEVTNGDYEADSLEVYATPMFGGFSVVDDENPGFVVTSAISENTMFMVELGQDDWVFWYEFHVPEYKVYSDWIYIDVTGTYGNEDHSEDLDFAIHVFPEPMTIALLGLGGLFLVRRRK